MVSSLYIQGLGFFPLKFIFLDIYVKCKSTILFDEISQNFDIKMLILNYAQDFMKQIDPNLPKFEKNKFKQVDFQVGFRF